MCSQELNPVRIKLVNIIEDRFRKPSSTEGNNILKNTAEIFVHIQSLWKSEEYAVADVEACLHYLEFDFIHPIKGGISWLIIPSS